VKKYQSNKAAGKHTTKVTPNPVVDVQAKTIPKATQQPFKENIARQPHYVVAPLPTQNAWAEKYQSDKAAGKAAVKVQAEVVPNAAQEPDVEKIARESIMKEMTPKTNPKKVEQREGSVAQSTATFEVKKDAWTEVPAKKKPVTRKAAGQKPTEADNAADTGMYTNSFCTGNY
jgi:hypothetical protein